MTAPTLTLAPSDLTSLSGLVDVVGERAARVDTGEVDVRPSLRDLGRVGFLGLGLPTETRRPGSVVATPVPATDTVGTLADQAEVIRCLARVCTATAFSVWAHRTAAGYLASWGSDELRAELLPDLLAGRRTAATAMATAFQAALGLRELSVTAHRDGDDVVLDGTIPWASNLFADGAVVVLAARTDEGRNLIVAITTDQRGVALRDQPELLALDATASTTVRLDGVRVPAHRVLTDRFLDFLADVRPAFLLLQTALCLGLADAALTAAARRLEGTTAILIEDHDALLGRRGALDAVFQRRLTEPAPADDELVRLRLEVSQLAVAVTRHEATATGGAGYLASSSTARRLREAAFLPIQSPTEAQLRWELSRSV